MHARSRHSKRWLFAAWLGATSAMGQAPPLLGQPSSAAPRASAAEIPPERGFSLTWEAPPECAERARTLGQLERLLGAPPEQLAVPPLGARVALSAQKAGSWRLILTTQRGGQSLVRELEAQSCTELADALALILAMAIDPEAIQRRSTQDPAPPSEPPPAPPPASNPPGPPPYGSAPATPPAVDSASNGQRRAYPRVLPPSKGPHPYGILGAGVTLGWGAIPNLAPGLSLTAGFGLGRFRMAILATKLLQQNAEERIDLDLQTVGAGACFRLWQSAQWAVAPCAITEIGSIGAAPTQGTEGWKGGTWAASGLGALVSRRLFGGLHLRGQADALLSWGTWDFRVADESAYRAGPLVLHFHVLLESHFQ